MERLSREPGAMDLRWSKVLLVASGWLDWYETRPRVLYPGLPNIHKFEPTAFVRL